MAKASNFNIKDLVQKGGSSKPAAKPAGKKKAKKAPTSDIIGQPTPPMPSGMGMGMY